MELVGDRLPGPAVAPGVVDLECFEAFQDLPQGRHRPEADRRVGVRGLGCEIDRIVPHNVSLG